MIIMLTPGITAPMPKKHLRQGKVPCGVCRGLVVDGKDESLLCTGECELWFHRGCASVPPSHYKVLSNSEEPFLCLSCVNMQLTKEVALLKNELRGIAEDRERCAALTLRRSLLPPTSPRYAKKSLHRLHHLLRHLRQLQTNGLPARNVIDLMQKLQILASLLPMHLMS